jgi:hypothetical protein
LWTACGGRKGMKTGKATLTSISPTLLPEDPNLILPSEKLLLQHPQYLCRPVGGNQLIHQKKNTQVIYKTFIQESKINIMG